MLAILGVGFLIGMQHATEADHVAAVSCIATKERSLGRIIRHGAVWGVGHTLTLLFVAGGAILFGAAIPEHIESILEGLVGLMLIGLGVTALVRVVREKIHFHRHRHGDGTVHLHAHSHAAEARPVAETHATSSVPAHDHAHPAGIPWRTLLVGMTHGVAGSAALLVLTVAGLSSPQLGIAYIALFGLGSILGMAILSACMAVPLAWSARSLTWAHNGLQALAGSATAILGVWIVTQSYSSL